MINKVNILISASILPAVSLISASYAGCDETLVVLCMTISVACHGFNSVGTVVNLYDLGPNYVAALTGVVNSVSYKTKYCER